MRTRSPALPLALVLLSLSACRHAPPSGAHDAAAHAWVSRSDANARLLLEVQARFAPEQAARLGMAGLDDRISDFSPGHRERHRQAVREALVQLEARRAAEKDPLVAQDLAILVQAAQRDIRGDELAERLQVPYYNLPPLVFSSVRALLDDQVDPARRPAALARVRTYAGLEPGATPLAQLGEPEPPE